MATRADWSRCPPAPCGPRGGSGTVRHMRRAAAHPAPSAPSHRQNQVRRGSIEEDARQTADVQRSRSGTEQMEMISSCTWCVYACIIQTISAIGPYTLCGRSTVHWQQHLASLCGPKGSIQAVRDAGEVVVHVMYRQQQACVGFSMHTPWSNQQPSEPPKRLMARRGPSSPRLPGNADSRRERGRRTTSDP